MSDVAEAPAAAEASAGTLLRHAREASGLHVAALAVALKVPVRKLEALEDDRFDDMGDAVFIRGLASSVCRTLKIDPRPVLERLPQTSAPRLVRDNEGLNAPFRAPKDGPQPSWLDAARQPMPLAVAALLVGAVVIAFLPARQHEEAAPPVALAPAPVATSALEPAPAATEPETPAVAVAVPVVAPVVAAQASAAAQTVNAPTTGIVVFRTKGESWVEVTDAKGVVPLRKMMTAGETFGASGALPLTVTIGKVDQTQVEVRGKKYDLRPVSKDNVARFEVK
jgi:cytoskeleton protein RodZ